MKTVTDAAIEWCKAPKVPEYIRSGKRPEKEQLAASSFLAGAEWMRKQFTLHGTDGCKDCETGRATMYVTLEGRCLGCAHKRYDSQPKEQV